MTAAQAPEPPLLPPAEDIYDLELEELQRVLEDIKKQVQEKVYNASYGSFDKFERKATKIRSLIELEISERQQVDNLLTFFFNGPEPDILNESPVDPSYSATLDSAVSSSSGTEDREEGRTGSHLADHPQSECGAETSDLQDRRARTEASASFLASPAPSSDASQKPPLSKGYLAKRIPGSQTKAGRKALADFMREKLASTRQETPLGVVVGKSTVQMPAPPKQPKRSSSRGNKNAAGSKEEKAKQSNRDKDRGKEKGKPTSTSTSTSKPARAGSTSKKETEKQADKKVRSTKASAALKGTEGATAGRKAKDVSETTSGSTGPHSQIASISGAQPEDSRRLSADDNKSMGEGSDISANDTVPSVASKGEEGQKKEAVEAGELKESVEIKEGKEMTTTAPVNQLLSMATVLTTAAANSQNSVAKAQVGPRFHAREQAIPRTQAQESNCHPAVANAELSLGDTTSPKLVPTTDSVASSTSVIKQAQSPQRGAGDQNSLGTTGNTLGTIQGVQKDVSANSTSGVVGRAPNTVFSPLLKSDTGIDAQDKGRTGISTGLLREDYSSSIQRSESGPTYGDQVEIKEEGKESAYVSYTLSHEESRNPANKAGALGQRREQDITRTCIHQEAQPQCTNKPQQAAVSSVSQYLNATGTQPIEKMRSHGTEAQSQETTSAGIIEPQRGSLTDGAQGIGHSDKQEPEGIVRMVTFGMANYIDPTPNSREDGPSTTSANANTSTKQFDMQRQLMEQPRNRLTQEEEGEEDIKAEENEKITEVEQRVHRLKQDAQELNQFYTRAAVSNKGSDSRTADATEVKRLYSETQAPAKGDSKPEPKSASKPGVKTISGGDSKGVSRPGTRSGGESRGKLGSATVSKQQSKEPQDSQESKEGKEEHKVAKKVPTRPKNPRPNPNLIPAHIEEAIVDYSKYWKSFQELFNGYGTEAKKFDWCFAIQDTYSMYKMFNSLLDDKTMFQFAFDVSPLEKTALDYFAYTKSSELLATKEISDRMLETKNQNVDGVRKAMLQAKLQERFKRLKEKRLLPEDAAEESAESRRIEKEVTQLLDVERKPTLLYRVVKNREEVYDIVTKAFSRKPRWNEMPHGVNLKHTWNLLWTWSKPNVDLGRLLVWQRVNHFPGIKNIARKDYLKRHIERCHNLNQKAAQMFNFTPVTYLLPSEYLELVEAFNKAQMNGEKHNYWIMKPCAKSRGRGISVLSSLADVIYGEPMIVQEYLKNPLLLGGYKFDMRIYVLVTSCNPLEVFLYREGFARLSTVRFSLDPETLSNRFIHLTNSSIQEHSRSKKEAPDSQFSGTKISLEQLKTKLWSQNIEFSDIWQQIGEIVVKSLAACQIDIPYNPCCFELLGYDIIIDSHLKCWLLEVNTSPSLGILNLLDDIVKIKLMDDLIDLLDVIDFDRKRLEEVLRRRMNETHKVTSLSGAQASKLLNRDLTYILNGQEPREYGEMPKFMGGFERLAPSAFSDRIIKLVGGQKLFGKHPKAI